MPDREFSTPNDAGLADLLAAFTTLVAHTKSAIANPSPDQFAKHRTAVLAMPVTADLPDEECNDEIRFTKAAIIFTKAAIIAALDRAKTTDQRRLLEYVAWRAAVIFTKAAIIAALDRAKTTDQRRLLEYVAWRAAVIAYLCTGTQDDDLLVAVLVAPPSTDPGRGDVDDPSAQPSTSVVDVPCTLRSSNRAVQLIAAAASKDAASPTPNASLIKGLARAWSWRRALELGEAASIHEVAKRDGVTSRYVARDPTIGLHTARCD